MARRLPSRLHFAPAFSCWILAALLAVALSALPAAAQQGATASLEVPDGSDTGEESPNVRLYNEYIAIIVNATEENTGRFAVQTTGGDPDRTSDDESPLIYMVPGQSPWTSYATIRIDGIDYVFGGPATERAGKAGLVGEQLVAPRIVDGRRIETAYQVGPVEATQVLSIIRSSTTGLLDTLRIEYRLVNTSDRSHNVGLRLVIDTMLGANDGAPLRVEESAITSDTAFIGEQIPDFWQAFDSLSDPRVTAQGTLRGEGVTPPDRVYFSNWGALADGLWEFDFQPGRDFTRLGEFELDSATALYWDPKPMAPGEQRTYVTHYGLGGISISPGQLSIGVTSESTVTSDPDRVVTFPVIAYIQNTGEGEARDVVARLELPQGLRPADGERLVRNLGNLPAGRTTQVTWRVALDRTVGGELTYTVRVEAINAESNAVSRSVRIVSPASLTITIPEKQGRLRIEDGQWRPLPYKVAARVENTGGADANSVILVWESPLGLELAAGDSAEKAIGPLMAGEAYEVTWHIQPSRRPYPFMGNLAYSVKGRIAGLERESRAEGFLEVPPLDGQVLVEPLGTDGEVKVGDYVLVRVVARNVRSLYGAEVEVTYDPDALQLVGGPLGVDRGRIFVEHVDDGESRYLGWSKPAVELKSVGVAGVRIAGDRGGAAEPTLHWVNDVLATLRFRALKPGVHRIELGDVTIMTDDEGTQLRGVAKAGGQVVVTQ